MTNKDRNKRLLWQLPVLIILIVASIFIVRSSALVAYRQADGFIFGTMYSITYQSKADLSKDISLEMLRVDSALSMFNDQSYLSKINNNEEASLNSMFEEVFRIAMKVSEETDGAFDITVAPLVNAWGFGFTESGIPSQETIDSLLLLTGYEKVRLEDGRIIKENDAIMLDCGAIAKGYGCDRVAKLLKEKGVDNFLVEIGGEIVAGGHNSKGKRWKIGITKPVEDSLATSNEIQTAIEIGDEAVATSGNYRNFYYKDGRKYAHTIDPKSGKPVEHGVLSATVLARDCATADAYATAFMVMGLPKAREVLRKHPELKAYFICAAADGSLELIEE